MNQFAGFSIARAIRHAPADALLRTGENFKFAEIDLPPERFTLTPALSLKGEGEIFIPAAVDNTQEVPKKI